MPDCRCHTPPFHHDRFDSKAIGTDRTQGRYADVSIETCKQCGACWVRYFVEYESLPGSGRWYRGRVADHVARVVTPETAVDVLAQLAQWFRGGSYFNSAGEKGSGPLHINAAVTPVSSSLQPYRAAAGDDSDFETAIVSVLQEALVCPRWKHPDMPGAAHLIELSDIINDGNRYAAFRQSETGQYFLEIIEDVEYALNCEWLPFDVCGLPLPSARDFLEYVLTSVKQHGLAEAMPPLRAHHAALLAGQ